MEKPEVTRENSRGERRKGRFRPSPLGSYQPETPSLPYKWYDTPNIHLCSIDDFRALCADMGVRIERAIVLDRNSKPINLPPLAANLLGEQAVFMLRRD